MSESARQNSWQTFATVREITTKEGTIFYLLLSGDRKSVCRIDERFIPLINEDFTAFSNETVETITLFCTPDTRDPCGWRLDVDYYRAVATGTRTPEPQPVFHNPFQTPPEEIDTDFDGVNITFKLNKDDHEFVKAIHKQLRTKNPAFTRFQDLNAYLFVSYLQTLRLQYPDLWVDKSQMPF